ncbi:hypothetical protein, conserved [Thermococcus kodakarensis KOD1]|uniref:Uncharacterized protein n=1 Tax=Thermococcus kodakarensis (strain ATCC BAA-918 / JCM 12380 / KOD1) TaxID=69014 RepID=Q5JIB7_THEKO|nr:hypothetical protein [Thermococcus kodakarensis]WCN28943.1 hypothetical protein POG15_04900 [Thermococcus kodakarensis]WCN31247.1 hypothetical protein POG21_04900 [Thermococcus kodakarensis]BAD85155.1 hypothetical protein, conserved [Thermococcus kodakarensis KOD1]
MEAGVEKLILRELREIKEELKILNSKIDNFTGYFDLDEEEIEELYRELEDAKKHGKRLEDVLNEL